MSPRAVLRLGVISMALVLASQLGTSSSASAASDAVALHVKRVPAAGTSFAYAELGEGRPLVMLNGTGSPMNEWDPRLLQQLSQAHRVVVFDYPGLGLSGKAPGVWRFDSAADWVAQFIRQVTHEPVDVLGWSMGGFIGQQLAERHSELVRRLVLAATNPGGRSTTLGPAWVQRADSNPVESDAGFLATNFPRTPQAQAAGRAFLHRLELALDSGAYPSEEVPDATYRAMVRAEDPWLRSEHNSKALSTLEAPTLVITGGRDVITPPANSRLLASLIPGARLHLVPGAGHSFLFQKPVEVARVFTDFLAGD